MSSALLTASKLILCDHYYLFPTSVEYKKGGRHQLNQIFNILCLTHNCPSDCDVSLLLRLQHKHRLLQDWISIWSHRPKIWWPVDQWVFVYSPATKHKLCSLDICKKTRLLWVGKSLDTTHYWIHLSRPNQHCDWKSKWFLVEHSGGLVVLSSFDNKAAQIDLVYQKDWEGAALVAKQGGGGSR